MIPEKVKAVLDAHNLRAVEFEEGSTSTAKAAAEKLGVIVGQIAKSLLLIGKNGLFHDIGLIFQMLGYIDQIHIPFYFIYLFFKYGHNTCSRQTDQQACRYYSSPPGNFCYYHIITSRSTHTEFKTADTVLLLIIIDNIYSI